jgi:mannose-6-phosphate isomerase-like protein (cupin superfamily)
VSASLKDAIASQEVLFLPNFSSALPGWPVFIDQINTAKLRGDADQRRSYYWRAPIEPGDPLHEKLAILQQALTAELNMDVRPINAYVNIAVGEEIWPAHGDPEDSLFVLCEGSVTWFLDDAEYTLHQGDAIFFPSMTNHEVRALTPRAAFIFAVG